MAPPPDVRQTAGPGPAYRTKLANAHREVATSGSRLPGNGRNVPMRGNPMRKLLRAAVVAALTTAAIMTGTVLTQAPASAHSTCWNGTNWDSAC